MGYGYHITRAKNWSESEANLITLKEWLDCIDRDPAMHRVAAAEVQIGDEVFRSERDGLAVWTEYSGNEPGGNQAWFDYMDGQIAVNNPDVELLDKMLDIAISLGAKVQGDDGDWYEKPVPLEKIVSPEDLKTLRWARITEIAGPIIMLAAVAWLVFLGIRWLLR